VTLINQLLAKETPGKVPFTSKHEAVTGKSVQRNKTNEERKKTRKRGRASEGFNNRVACFGWVVCVARSLRLHNSGQELMTEISTKTLAVGVKHQHN